MLQTSIRRGAWPALGPAGLLVLLLSASPGHARAISDYSSGYAQYREALMDALCALTEGEREKARSGLATASSRWMDLHPITVSADFIAQVGQRKARALARLYRPILRHLEKAHSDLQDPKPAVDRALKRAKQASRRNDTASRLLSKVRGPVVVLLERSARSAGFHRPNKRVKFLMVVRNEDGERCFGTPQVRVFNHLGADAVDPLPRDLKDDGSFVLVVGEEKGVARVEVTLCGTTDSRFLFSKGPPSRACGNGSADAGEECDDGAANSDSAPDACRTDCRHARCGDDVIDSAEACEPALDSTGCAAGDQCIPAGLLGQCTCVPPCAVSPPPTTVSVISGFPSGVCGCTLNTAAEVTCGSPAATVRDLYCGDLLIGGGGSFVEPESTPDGVHVVTAVEVCGGAELILGASAGTSSRDCTMGLDAEGNARCFFGPPRPVPKAAAAALSTCVLNAIKSDVTGRVDTSTGVQRLDIELASGVFLTGTSLDDPGTPALEVCPLCVDSGGAPVPGGPGTCNAGKNAGKPCQSTGTTGLTIDCPPTDDLWVETLRMNLSPLISGPVTLSAPDGNFCNFGTCDGGDRNGEPCNNDEDCPQATCTPACQGGTAHGVPCTSDDDCQQGASAGVCGQAAPGAFQEGRAVRRIIETGVAAPAPVRVGDTRPITLATVFCIPLTGHSAVDAISSLPGPAAMSFDGTISIE